MRENALKGWEEQIPFLLKQKEYQTLVTEIDELQLRSVHAQVRMANLMAPPPEETGKSDNVVPMHEKKLKRD